MALPATDAFGGVNGTALATWNASWTVLDGALELETAAVIGTESGGGNGALWNADTFNDAQYAQCTVTLTAGGAGGPGVRMAATRGYVAMKESSTTIKLFRWDSNETYVELTPSFTGLSLNDSDVNKLTANGSTLEILVNGVSIGTRTDATYASGSGGIFNYFTAGATPRLDDWEGGNLAAGGAAPYSSIPKLMGVRRIA